MFAASGNLHSCVAALVCAIAISACQSRALAGEQSILARIVADHAASADLAVRGPVSTAEPTRSVVWRTAQNAPRPREFDNNPDFDARPSFEPSSRTGPDDQKLAAPGRNFEEWQKRADEKLKEEETPGDFEHPLAKRNPRDFIVVCEAGCRNGPDAIVSRVEKPLAFQSQERSFGPTSAASQINADAEPAPGVVLDPATIRCEAGCSGVAKTHKARLPRSSSLALRGRRLAGLRRYPLALRASKKYAPAASRLARHLAIRRIAVFAAARNREAGRARAARRWDKSQVWRMRRAVHWRPRPRHVAALLH